MKQKIVIKINVKCDKCHNKALKAASAVKGVESVAIQGGDRDCVVVTGERIDSVSLTRGLRKKVGYAEIISVGRMDSESQESEELIRCDQYVPQSYNNYHGVPQRMMMYHGAYNAYPNVYNYYYSAPPPPPPPHMVYDECYDSRPSVCSIM